MTELVLRKPFFKWRLYLSDEPYYMNRSEKDGEADLFKVVKKAENENSWVFFPETSTWVNYATSHEVNPEGDGLRVNFELLDETPFGEEQIYYHIHPDKAWHNEDRARQAVRKLGPEIEEELVSLFRSIPSGTDFISAAEKMYGKEMRVLSSLGVFSLKGYQNPAKSFGDYVSFVRNSIELETIKESGLVPAIQEMVYNMNSVANEYVTVNFRPKP